MNSLIHSDVIHIYLDEACLESFDCLGIFVDEIVVDVKVVTYDDCYEYSCCDISSMISCGSGHRSWIVRCICEAEEMGCLW